MSEGSAALLTALRSLLGKSCECSLATNTAAHHHADGAGETFYEPTGCLHRVSKNPAPTGKTG